MLRVKVTVKVIFAGPGIPKVNSKGEGPCAGLCRAPENILLFRVWCQERWREAKG